MGSASPLAGRALGALRASHEYLLVSLVFVVSRAALHIAGVRLNFDLNWMFLSDPADLRDRLLQTLYYAHAYPPGMNLLTGVLLKTSAHGATVAELAFRFFGLALVNALFYLGRAGGLSFGAALGLAVTFCLTPPSIYFEHLYVHTWPVAALVCLAAALFHVSIRRPSFARWSLFFAVCAVLCWLRSTFHLIWFGAMVAFALAFSSGRWQRVVALAAIGPAALVVALYLKNLAVFGVFGASTFGAANLTTITVRRLPPEVRDAWVQEGKLSPFAAVDVYAGPRDYLPYFKESERPKWPPQLNALERPTLGAPNFNHWLFLEVNPRRRQDAFRYLAARPREYASSVAENLSRMFRPATEWHPFDKTEASPHHEHRRVLGRYEAAYNSLVHRIPLAPAGLYLFLPLVFGWAVIRARSLVLEKTGETEAGGALLYFCLFQIAYVLAVSVFFAFAETARYRYEVEPLMWWAAALSIARLWHWAGDRLRARHGWNAS